MDSFIPLATSLTSDDTCNSLQSTDHSKGIKRPIEDQNCEHPSPQKKSSDTLGNRSYHSPEELDFWQNILSISQALEKLIAGLDNYVFSELAKKSFKSVNMNLRKYKAKINRLQNKLTQIVLDNNNDEGTLKYGNTFPSFLIQSDSPNSVTDVCKRFDDAFVAHKREMQDLRTGRVGASYYSLKKSFEVVNDSDSGSETSKKKDRNLPSQDEVKAMIKEAYYWKEFDYCFRKLKHIENDIRLKLKTKPDGKWCLTVKQEKQFSDLKKDIEILGRKLDVKKVESSENGYPEMRELPISQRALEIKVNVTSASQVHNFFSKVEKDLQSLLSSVDNIEQLC